VSDRSWQGSLLEVGVLGRAHGVRGQIKLHLHNPASAALEGAACRVTLVTDEGVHERDLEVTAATGEQLIVRLQGVEDRDAAEALRGARVLVGRASLEPPGEDEYYYVDLIGCQVVDELEGEVGLVHDVFEAGASDVLVVRDGSQERYVPLVEQWVVSVDLEARRITVRGIEQWESWPV